jgi:hypothetical protein
LSWAIRVGQLRSRALAILVNTFKR